MKIKFVVILIVLSFLLSCEKKSEIPRNSKLIAKYIVFNNEISSKIITDLKNVEQFDNKKSDGKKPFKLNGEFYKVETEYRLDSNEKLEKLIENLYNSFNYSSFGLKRTEIQNRETLGQTFNVKFSETNQEIIDCKDSFKIEKIFPKEKLIFVKNKRKDQRLVLYEYK